MDPPLIPEDLADLAFSQAQQLVEREVERAVAVGGRRDDPAEDRAGSGSYDFPATVRRTGASSTRPPTFTDRPSSRTARSTIP